MNRKARLLFFTALAPCLTLAAEEIWPDSATVASANEGDVITKHIAVDDASAIKAKFEISTKGNGVLILPGLAVGVFDSHANGVTFREGLLRCAWVRQTNGETRLEISGTAEFWSEKGEKLDRTKLVRAILKYDGSQRRFRVVANDPEIYVQEAPSLPEN
ncbi:MAG: hypothetical protein C0518_00005 [Opitutus sp.]|nr:hypothetical protein [Opitutus sp.]